MGNELDDAFNYLVVVLSIMAGALSGWPELYVSPPYPYIPEGGYGLAMLKLTIIPVVILICLWLWGLLARNKESRVVVKSVSWVLAFIILITDLTLLFFATLSLPSYAPGEAPGGPGPLLPVLLLIFFAPAYLSVLLGIFVIRPRLKEIHKDSRFLNHRGDQGLLYVGAVLYYYFYYFIFCGWI